MTELAAKNITESADDPDEQLYEYLDALQELRLYERLLELQEAAGEQARIQGRIDASSDLVLLAEENGTEVYAAFQAKLGKAGAATFVMCMLQQAVEDGSISATRFTSNTDESNDSDEALDLTILETSSIEAGCIKIHIPNAASVFIETSEQDGDDGATDTKES